MKNFWKQCGAVVLALILALPPSASATAAGNHTESTLQDDGGFVRGEPDDGNGDDSADVETGEEAGSSGDRGELVQDDESGSDKGELVQDDGSGSDRGELVQDDNETGEVITDTSADDHVVISGQDKPYLALGANLNQEQKRTVLNLMGIDPANLDQYQVVTVTNQEEHQYLDEYLDASTIGSRALSSVVIVKREKGAGIHISTRNISYCTVGMYKNALATAGLEDADVIVAGPFPLSGTAALIGAMKAYADMENTDIDPESLDTAMNEIVVTGGLVDSLGAESQPEEFIAYIKQKVLEEGEKSVEGIHRIIEEACSLFDVSLSDTQKNQIASLMEKVSSLDLNVDNLLKQAGSIYESIANMKDESGFLAGIADFFKRLMDAVAGFFRGLF